MGQGVTKIFLRQGSEPYLQTQNSFARKNPQACRVSQQHKVISEGQKGFIFPLVLNGENTVNGAVKEDATEWAFLLNSTPEGDGWVETFVSDYAGRGILVDVGYQANKFSVDATRLKFLDDFMGNGAKCIGDIEPCSKLVDLMSSSYCQVLIDEKVMFDDPIEGSNTLLCWRNDLMLLAPKRKLLREALSEYLVGSSGKIDGSPIL
ncbi:hypothetical protein TNIN_474731 [Trichonephila inaurata madagascariensis]|uniref:Uncharacterized protein n=1 Tax=Trichonephila inaurata madagascariensis TaxID=2747483 RepID=A0A8X7C9E8_9ARAC|nr:hypothetical protein TNIN_474731 [Trichonephila inaurata madagascariensis]